jgi:hypothetical protein
MSVRMVKIYEKEDKDDWSGLRDFRLFKPDSPPDPKIPDVYTDEERAIFEADRDNRHAYPGLYKVSRRFVGNNVFTQTFYFDTEENAVGFVQYVHDSATDQALRQMVKAKLQAGEIPSYRTSVYILRDDGTIRQMGSIMQGSGLIPLNTPVE